MATTEERLATLRAQLKEAEHAVANVAKDADDDIKAAAKATHKAAQKALAMAHFEAKAAAEKVERELRVVENALKGKTLQESNQSASTQNVRGTEDLTPEQHAARRNPTHVELPFRSAL